MYRSLPDRGVFGQEMTVDQMLDEVEQGRSFCRESWRWITLSAGQCMLQPDFAAALRPVRTSAASKWRKTRRGSSWSR